MSVVHALKRRETLWPFLLAATITWCSGHPATLPEVSGLAVDKIGHFGLYGALATAIIRHPALLRWPWLGLWWALPLASAYGMGDEFRQSLTHGIRTADWHDWLADTIGAAVAVSLYIRWPWYRRLMETPLWNPARLEPCRAFRGAMAKTPDELFDVVDAQDRVVRQAPRREVHARGWLHRAVHVLVFNRAGLVFLQKRSMAKDMSPGLWDSSCSGHLDAGEDYDTAAWRELQEEIGLLAEPVGSNRGVGAPRLQRWLRVEACEATGQEFVWVYRLKSDGPFTLCPDEIERGEWIAPDELNRRIAARPGDYCSAFRLIWGKTQA